MTDSLVVVPLNPSGPNVDTSQVTRGDGTILQRQRMVIADPNNMEQFGNVTPAGAVVVDGASGNMQIMTDMLAAILTELRIVTVLLTQLGSPSINDIDSIRADLANDAERFN